MDDNDDDSWQDSESSDDEEYSPDEEEFDDRENMEDDSDGENEGNREEYTLRKEVEPEGEKQFIVSESALAELLSVCRSCGSVSNPVIQYRRGTMIVTQSVCINGHRINWKSQQCHNGMPWNNIFTAMAILTSGCNASKVLQLFNNMNVQVFSGRTYNRLQRLYVIPSITTTWDCEQRYLLSTIQGGCVTVGGDARCDSPGYSAKYGSYTLMDLERNKILDIELVQVTIVYI